MGEGGRVDLACTCRKGHPGKKCECREVPGNETSDEGCEVTMSCSRITHLVACL